MFRARHLPMIYNLQIPAKYETLSWKIHLHFHHLASPEYYQAKVGLQKLNKKLSSPSDVLKKNAELSYETVVLR